MTNIFISVFNFILNIDLAIGQNIKHLLNGYALDAANLPISYNVILLSIKVVIYDLFLLLLFSFLKIINRSNSYISILFIISLILFGGAMFLIFLGFFQTLFP
jgi:hypothetical protein